MKILGTIAFAACCLAGMFCGVASLYCQICAARHRKSGVPFTSALSTVNILARPELYSEWGLHFRKTFLRCVIGFVLSAVTGVIIGLVTGAAH